MRSADTGTNATGQGLFHLPPELRNHIYELVLAPVEGNVTIRLDGGPNADEEEQQRKANEHRTTQRRVDREKTKKRKAAGWCKAGKRKDPSISRDTGSLLNILLVCKQIGSEASGIAYSYMSLSLMNLPSVPHHRPDSPYPSSSEQQQDRLDDADRVAVLLTNLRKVFSVEKLQHVTKLYVRNLHVMSQLQEVNYLFAGVSESVTEDCAEDCQEVEDTKGPVHDAFYRITRLTVTDGDDTEWVILYQVLKPGASWLSIDLLDGHQKMILDTYPSLQEIVVRRECGEQVSRMVNGYIFAPGSETPIGGLADHDEI